MTLEREVQISLEVLVQRSGDLYALPPVVAHFNRVLNDPDSTAQDVADTISTDVVIATKVLRLVNSAFFGFSRRIGSLKTAIVILGFNEIRKLVLTLGTFQAVTDVSPNFPYKAFWRHSVAVGLFAEAVLALKHPAERDDAFVAGLLHDLGKLVIAQEAPHCFARLQELADAGATWRSAEEEVLGFDHAELGGALGIRWDFPDPLVEAIRHHHDLGSADEQLKLAAAIHLGDVCVRASLVDLPRSGSLAPVDEAVWEILGIDANGLDRFFASITRGLTLVEEILGVAP